DQRQPVQLAPLQLEQGVRHLGGKGGAALHLDPDQAGQPELDADPVQLRDAGQVVGVGDALVQHFLLAAVDQQDAVLVQLQQCGRAGQPAGHDVCADQCAVVDQCLQYTRDFA